MNNKESISLTSTPGQNRVADYYFFNTELDEYEQREIKNP